MEMRKRTYAVEADGERNEHTFSEEDVSDDRIDDDVVAIAYARHLAVDEYGIGIDVTEDVELVV